jgi:hypothetical protein
MTAVNNFYLSSEELELVILKFPRIALAALLAVTILLSFSHFPSPEANAVEEQNVQVTAKQIRDIILLVVRNESINMQSISKVDVLIGGASLKAFKGFKTWEAEANGQDQVTFTTSIPLKPGEKISFMLKVGVGEPLISWQTFDGNSLLLAEGGLKPLTKEAYSQQAARILIQGADSAAIDQNYKITININEQVKDVGGVQLTLVFSHDFCRDEPAVKFLDGEWTFTGFNVLENGNVRMLLLGTPLNEENDGPMDLAEVSCTFGNVAPGTRVEIHLEDVTIPDIDAKEILVAAVGLEVVAT